MTNEFTIITLVDLVKPHTAPVDPTRKPSNKSTGGGGGVIGRHNATALNYPASQESSGVSPHILSVRSGPVKGRLPVEKACVFAVHASPAPCGVAAPALPSVDEPSRLSS